jgi:hypothetical protein
MQYRGGSYAILKCFERHPSGTRLGKARSALPCRILAPNLYQTSH